MRPLLILMLCALLLTACAPNRPAPAQGGPVTISAAASLGDVLNELQGEFLRAHPGDRLLINLGSSGALARQIEQGAPVDLFLAAGVEPVDGLVQKGLVRRQDVVTLATNDVVLIRPAGASVPAGWAGLPPLRRIALGNPEHVPVGVYGREALTALGLWEQVKPKLVFGEDVRQVLQFVAAGEADAGIVYRTDAAGNARVTVAAGAPPGSHRQVVYPMALISAGPNPAGARRLAEFLRSAPAQAILARSGFGKP